MTSIVRAIAFLLLPLPILYLFRAAQARNPRVRASMVGFVFIGPILFATQGVVSAVGENQAASDFVKQASSEEVRAYAEFQRQRKQDPGSIEKVTIYTGGDTSQLEVEQTNGTFYTVDRYPANAGSSVPAELDMAQVDNDTDSDADSQAGDALAAHIRTENSTIQVAAALAIPGLLGLAVMMVYVPLQGQRVGLLSRFFGSLGIALGAALILVPPALIAVMVWTGYLGLMFVNRVPGGRPPAWDVGEAVPWPRPDAREAASEGGNGAIEGTASEAEAGGQPASGSGGQGPPARRKRKRRS
jgi:hypothetical protein